MRNTSTTATGFEEKSFSIRDGVQLHLIHSQILCIQPKRFPWIMGCPQLLVALTVKASNENITFTSHSYSNPCNSNKSPF